MGNSLAWPRIHFEILDYTENVCNRKHWKLYPVMIVNYLPTREQSNGLAYKTSE